MIFVTVGTHEQGFNRLIKTIDELVRDGKIKEDVFMQIGYSTYEPKYTKWDRVRSYADMKQYMDKSDVIITHGGPSTYMQVLQSGKIPVVVPRESKYNEHINDHQLWVSKQVVSKGYELLLCEDLNGILSDIEKSKTMRKDFQNSNNSKFVTDFIDIVKKL